MADKKEPKKWWKEFEIYEFELSPCNKLMFKIYEYCGKWWIKIQRYHKGHPKQEIWDETMITIFIEISKIAQLKEAVRLLDEHIPKLPTLKPLINILLKKERGEK